jgi:iron(III) transport system substrate-binding protein
MKSKKTILCLFPVVMFILAIVVAGFGQQAIAASAAPAQKATPAEFAKVKADWEKVLVAAKKEGTLTAYGNFPEITLAAMNKAWNVQYPDIKLRIVAVEGTEMLERVKAEQVSKNVVGDIILGPDSQMWTLQDLKILAATYPDKVLPNLNDPSIPWKTKPWADEPTTLNGFMYSIFNIAVNTKLVPPEKEPKSWMDLTDPWFKGKIVVLNPGSGTGLSWYMCMRIALGVDFHKALAANKAIITAVGSDDIPTAVAAGEYAVQIPGKAEIYVKLPKEAPIKMLWPKEGIRVGVSCATIPLNAPHPNAALVFENFLLSKDMQIAIGLVGRPPARTDATSPYTELVKANSIPWISFDKQYFLTNQKTLSTEARQIYGIQ